MKKIFNSITELISSIPVHIKFLLSVYLLGILFFTSFRLLLLIINWDYALELPTASRFSLLMTSFFYGFRFDTVISGYILAFPFLILSVFSFFKKSYLLPLKISLALFLLLYFVAFFVAAANIPYFKYFFTNITSVVFNWAEDFGFAVSMVVQDFFMLIYFFLFLGVYALFVFLMFKLYRKVISSNNNVIKSSIGFYLVRSGLFIFFTLVLFLAIRGRVEEKSPIRIGTAYFSEYSFANQLGLNPVYTLLASAVEDSKLKNEQINLIEENTALSNVKNYFGITGEAVPTPISRGIYSEKEPTNKNVVLVIMESMSAVRMDYFGYNTGLTPTLDSLSTISTTFKNFYTAGIHTYNGVYSTLFSYPTIWNLHPMKPSVIPHIHSIVDELKKNNYHNYFFVAHDDQFDNMGGFLYENGFEKIFSERNYPSEWILSTLGVPDHILFEETVKILNQQKDDKPFFAALLTASNHDPKIIPDGINFTPKAKEEDERLVQYCDWSVKHFLDEASKSEWYNNTIFIFIADHGRSVKQPYDVPLSFFHSPFIIYSPAGELNIEQRDNLTLQVDVMPTIAGLLNIPYTNSTFGIDALNETRPFAYFSNDNSLGVLSKKFFLIEKRNSDLSLYDYKSQSLENLISTYRLSADSMTTYSHSMLQTSQYIIKNYSKIR